MLRLAAPPGSPRGERGFTLIEILVASVIGIVVLALAISWMQTTVRGADRAGTRAAAGVATDRAIARLRQDLASARARDRAADAIYDPLDFATAIRSGTPLRGYDADGVTVRELDVQDVVLASDRVLVFSSSRPDGTRCIRWRVDNGALVREELGGVDQGCSDTMPVTRRSELLPPSADGRSSVGAPFSYVLADPQPGAARCATVTAGAAQGGRRGAILAVLVDVQALAGHAAIEGRSGRTTRIDLRSRHAEEYQRALGCAG